jgi:hypothetical protein
MQSLRINIYSITPMQFMYFRVKQTLPSKGTKRFAIFARTDIYHCLFIIRKLAADNVKQAHLAMLSTRLPVIQRLARFINDRSRLIRVLSDYLGNVTKNEAEEQKYSIVEVQAEAAFEVTDKIVHVVRTWNDKVGKNVVRVHPGELGRPNFQNSQDLGYAYRILALLNYEEVHDCANSYRESINHTTTNKLNTWWASFTERVTGRKRKIEVKKKRKRKKKGQETAVEESNVEPVDEEAVEDDWEGEDGTSDEESADMEQQSTDGTATAARTAANVPERLGNSDGKDKELDVGGSPGINREVAQSGGEVTQSGGIALIHATGFRPSLARTVTVKCLPRTAAPLVSAEREFYVEAAFDGPVPYVIPEAFINLAFRRQPIAHLALDRTCAKPHHICCIIGLPVVYVPLFHALVHAERLAEVRTVALLVPTDFNSAER